MLRNANLIVRLCVILASFIFTLNIVFAKSPAIKPTIYIKSIEWENQQARTKLLEGVPTWHDDVITLLFDVYLYPGRYQLETFNEPLKHNIQFINAFWGPVSNPFTKYQRPAKAFLFIGKKKHEPEFYYMAPLIQNEDNGKYYIFDNNQNKPIRLEHWVENIRNLYPSQTLIRFNICNNYGNLPDDTCSSTYQTEALFIKKYTFKHMSHNARPSAHRELHEDWQARVEAFHLRNTDLPSSYIYKESIEWTNIQERNNLLNTVTGWPNYQSILDAFKKIRDIRYFTDDEFPSFLRRISWLYPDDGCWTRATAVIRDLFGPFNNVVNQLPRPSKVFVFGNLCANTHNSPDSYVAWWYHTAPIVKDTETKHTYVLDPSINPYLPLSLESWVAEISSRKGACSDSNSTVRRFAICNGFGTHPYESCQDKTLVNFATETSSMLDQREYRISERKRQDVLGRDPNQVLGEYPPWLS